MNPTCEDETRVYVELRTVRGKDNASDVLRHHQTEQERLQERQRQEEEAERRRLQDEAGTSTSTVHQADDSTATVTSSPSSSSSLSSRGIKQEVMEYPATPVNPDSVQPMSVRPGQPGSVLEVAPHLPASGKVGRGSKEVSINYKGSTIGPILLKDEEETILLAALVREKAAEKEARGKSFST